MKSCFIKVFRFFFYSTIKEPAILQYALQSNHIHASACKFIVQISSKYLQLYDNNFAKV